MRPEAEFTLLWTAQEALANVGRHAEATRVGVTLSYISSATAVQEGMSWSVRPAPHRPAARHQVAT
jgi:signal transduction histidine kinase